MNKDDIQTFSYRISQANRTELIVIMYDMAAGYIRQALETQESDGKNIYNQSIVQAKRVVDRLMASLDMQYEISAQLYRVYSVIQRYLIKAMAEYTEDGRRLLESSHKMLESLRRAFYEVSLTDSSGPLMKNTQQVYAGLTYSNAGSSNEFSQDFNNRGFKV